MEIERLKKIVNHNNTYSDQIAEACFRFYKTIGRSSATVLPDIQTVAEMIFADKGYKLIHIPMKSREIGAFQLRLNGYNCLFLNSSRNRAYSNFSVAHELYHILIQSEELNSFDIYREEYIDDENEMMANAFAGNILMPEDDFNTTFDNYNRIIEGILQEEREKHFKEYLLVLSLANYFRTTYMSVVVRCFETHKFSIGNESLILELLSSNDKEMFKGIFGKIAGVDQNNSLAEATRQDDFKDWIEEAKKQGEENVRKGLLSKEELNYRLDGMKECYREVVDSNVGSENNR